MEPSLHGPNWDAEAGRALSLVQSLQVEERDRCALSLWKPTDRFSHDTAELGRCEHFLWSAFAVARFDGEAQLGDRHSRSLTQPSSTHVEPDTKQPWSESTRVVQSIQTDERPQRCLLSGVLGHLRVPKHAAADREERALVPTQQSGERVLITRSRCCREVRICLQLFQTRSAKFGSHASSCGGVQLGYPETTTVLGEA